MIKEWPKTRTNLQVMAVPNKIATIPVMRMVNGASGAQTVTQTVTNILKLSKRHWKLIEK